MRKYPVSDKISRFASVFKENGFCLYIVGGAVRDWLLGIPNSDYDFCTDALPEQVISIFRKVIPTGIKHGTVTVLFQGESYEVTTFRTEGAYSDQRHPDNVTFVRNLEEDLSRRDFTVNAFAADCTDGRIIDLFDGLSDLKSKTIRAIGDPKERFKEDALRMMRLARFCAKLGFKADPSTLLAASELSSDISVVSQERIFDELSKTLMSKVPTVGLRLMEETGIMQIILPELTDCRKIEQTKVGAHDVLEHIYNTVDASASLGYNFTVRLAALLHDIGKPSTMFINTYGIMRFHGHDIKSAEMARTVMRRLKCSNKLTDDVCIIIENHMVKYRSDWTDGAVKRFIRRVGKENINNLFELQWCDQIASEGRSRVDEYDQLIRRIHDLEDQPMSVKDLAISGDDLAKAGIPRSKVMGDILNALLEMVIDYPTLNTTETLLEQAIILYKKN
ncbi:MAG: HD domain-containing protein [Spirochaetales bacterium]|nr:HD domain-containing protein [Spirochaetales bacterium]